MYVRYCRRIKLQIPIRNFCIDVHVKDMVVLTGIKRQIPSIVFLDVSRLLFKAAPLNREGFDNNRKFVSISHVSYTDKFSLQEGI